MSNITIPNTFVNNTELADANKVNANFTAVTAVVNGGIDNTNIASAAGIALSKIDLASGGNAFNKAATAVTTWSTGLTTDTNPQLGMVTDGGLQFGAGGSSAFDLALIRSAAKTLQLTDAAGGTATAFDLKDAALTSAGSIALKNTNALTITPAAMGAARAVALPDPGGAASLFCANSALANHQLVTFDGSIYQGLSPGTAGKLVRSNGTDWVAVAPFQSADQTITAAGALTLAHGLGYTPLKVWMALVNVTGEANYTAGQVVYVDAMTTGTVNQGYSAIVDGTNLTIRYGSAATTFSAPDATTGAATALTNANWHCRFFAE